MKINSYKERQYFNTKENDNDNVSSNIEANNNMNSINNSVDSIEISENSKHLNSIKSKIEGGFYDNPNLLKEVAEKILNTIDTKA